MIIVTIRDEILGEDGCVIGARLTPFEGSVTNGEIRNGGWRWRGDDGGTFNGSKNLHNTRLMYTPLPLSSPLPSLHDPNIVSERLCARQTPKLRTGRTLSMAPVAIFFVRDAQMHRAFDNWSGTNDISFARCVAYRFTSFWIVRRLQTPKDIVTNPAITTIESRNRYIYIRLEIIEEIRIIRLPRPGGKLNTGDILYNFYLSNLANYALDFITEK